MSKQNPVSTENTDIVGGEREFRVADVNGVGLDQPEIDLDNTLGANIEMEKFLQDVLTVQFMPPANENEPKFVEVNVNGHRVVARRGDTVKMKRFQVAVLAQSKIGRIEQIPIEQPGSKGFVEREVFSMSYPFAVTHDPNPRGAAWLKQQLANPV